MIVRVKLLLKHRRLDTPRRSRGDRSGDRSADEENKGTTMARSVLRIAVAAASVTASMAFAPSMHVNTSGRTAPSRPLQAVLDIDSEAAFDDKISSAGDSLVIIDYSTTWCGPCKVIAPKFDELSDTYPDSVFIKVSVGE